MIRVKKQEEKRERVKESKKGCKAGRVRSEIYIYIYISLLNQVRELSFDDSGQEVSVSTLGSPQVENALPVPNGDAVLLRAVTKATPTNMQSK